MRILTQRINFTLLFLAAMAAWSTAAIAKPYIAQPGAQPQSNMTLTPMVGVSEFYGFEVGAKMGWKISDPGFVPMINNSVYIEGSALVSQSGHLFIAPLLFWGFHLHPQWTVFGEAGAELGAHFGSDSDRDHDATGLRHPGTASGLALATGGIWHFQKDMSLRLEFDLSHQAPRIGLQFPL